MVVLLKTKPHKLQASTHNVEETFFHVTHGIHIEIHFKCLYENRHDAVWTVGIIENT